MDRLTPEPRQSPGQLCGRVAVVTGSSGGIGSAIVAALEAEGWRVVRTDIVGGPNALRLDLSTPEGNKAMISEAVQRHGRIDALVLNAGLQAMSSIAEFEETDWRRLLAVMLDGPFFAIKYAWPELISRRGSRIIVTGSTSSVAAEPYKAAYVVAKHGLLGLTRVAALEGAAHGLTANLIAPGWVMTPLVEGQLSDRTQLYGVTQEQAIEEMVGSQPGERFVDPMEVAALVAFLASSRSSGINGACIPVDLGYLAT